MSDNNELLDVGMPSTSPSIIKVIGVGGGGGNAVNHMYREVFTMSISYFATPIAKH